MRWVLAAVLIANVSCSRSPTEPMPGGSVSLRYGETATVAGTRISFTEIIDSRCAKEVVCAWAGDAAVHLQSGSEQVVLHTNRTAGEAMGRLGGITILLTEVKPEPRSLDTKKTDYVVSLHVSE